MADSFEEIFSTRQIRAYMVEFDVPPLTEEIVKLIPQQRMTVGMMMSAGTVLTYTLSADRRRLWSIMIGNSAADIEEVLRRFPISKFMHYRIHELIFHEAAQAGIPKASMN